MADVTRRRARSILDSVHGGFVFERRAAVLARHLAEMLPRDARALDVGCGDGLIARLFVERRPDVRVEGIDVLVRPATRVEVSAFDGRVIPRADGSVDAVTFVDVLHHAGDTMGLLREAVRVTKKTVLIKDHFLDGVLAGPVLRLMDWVGNARHGVALPYNYWTEARWQAAFRELDLDVVELRRRIGLYPPPASWIFERGLHFVARLERT